MKETLKLELNFKNEEGKSKKLTIDNPAQDLTEAEIVPAMQSIIDAQIFARDGIQNYVEINGARYVATTVEDVFEVE